MSEGQKTRWQQYREAMQTLAAALGTTVECTGKYERLGVHFETSGLTAEQAAALSVVEDLFELVSEFPPGFLEQLERPSKAAATALAALGGSMPNLTDVPRRRT